MIHTTTTAAAAAPRSEALRCAEWLEHIALGGNVVTMDELARTAAAELRSLDALTTDGLAWAIHRWEDEVKHRPLINVHRRSLYGVWRQVVRYFGGNAETLLGPSHDELIAEPQAAAQEAEPADPARLLADPERRDAARRDGKLASIWRNRVAGLIEDFAPDATAQYLADRIVSELYDLPPVGVPRPQAPALLEGRAHLTYTLTAESGYEQTGEHHNITPEVFGAMIAALHSPKQSTNEVLATEQSTALAEHAARYEWLRSRDLDAVEKGGVFAGKTPDNVVLNGADLDAAIDAAIAAQR